MKKYYVYQHVTADTGEIFYIGKGFNKRAYSKNNRNKYWHNIVTKHGYNVEILYSELDESSALRLEAEMIQSLKSLDLCKANLSTGGTSGASGIKWSTESRNRLSKAKSGVKLSESHKTSIGLSVSGTNNGFYGKRHSDEFKRQISEQNSFLNSGSKNPAARKVIDLDSGQIFGTAKDAAEFRGIRYITLYRSLSGKTKKDYRLRYLEI